MLLAGGLARIILQEYIYYWAAFFFYLIKTYADQQMLFTRIHYTVIRPVYIEYLNCWVEYNIERALYTLYSHTIDSYIDAEIYTTIYYTFIRN